MVKKEHQTRRKQKQQSPHEKGSTQTTRKAKKNPHLTRTLCNIPTQVPVLNYSSSLMGNNFYEWVNCQWLEHAKIPPHENDYGVSEEVEECVDSISEKILETTSDPLLKTLRHSCLTSSVQQNNVEHLKHILHTLDCIETKENLARSFARLLKLNFSSFLSLQYTIDEKGNTQLCLDGNTPSLPLYFYDHRMDEYKHFLEKLSKELNFPALEKVASLEKSMTLRLENLWKDDKTKTTGNGLVRKFPGFPWESFFLELGIDSWKKTTFYYKNPGWFRYLSRTLNDLPLTSWKRYIARSYILGSIGFLPPPFDQLEYEFFQKTEQGQKVKRPQKDLLLRIVNTYCVDHFSPFLWKKMGSKKLEKEITHFAKNLVKAAKQRLAHVDWMKQSTRVAAIEKVEKMTVDLVRPDRWASSMNSLEMDPHNLLKNIFTLAEENTKRMIERAGKPYMYWEHGIQTVNAFYYAENNEMVIPMGTLLEPFFSVQASAALNFGSIGSILGHEMCHGFDEDGKDYNPLGQKKEWWTVADKKAYNKKAKALVELFGKQKVCGLRVKGKRTLSENIADLGGLGIALDALKQHLEKHPEMDRIEALREFFISFAQSWRTKYRNEKLKQSIQLDRHSPAFLRVNLIVSQFDEWYEAFGITHKSSMYIPPDKRIRIF